MEEKYSQDEERREEQSFPLQMKRSLTKQERIKKKRDIQRVFTSAKKVSCHGAVLLYMNNNLSKNRIAITLPKKYGNAVKRNRAKRVARELYRHEKGNLVKGQDIVIILYPSKDEYGTRQKQLRTLFNKAGLYL